MKMARQWFTMKSESDFPDEAEIMLYGQIGKTGWMDDDEMSASDFDKELKKLGPVKHITMRINSPGGNVMDGLAIYNTLKAHPAKITARVDGIAASAASMVAMAGDEIHMPENSFMLIHEPSGFTVGTAKDHRAQADDLDRMTDTFASLYAMRSKQTPDDVRALMAENRLMPAKEAMDKGYCDQMCAPVKMTAAYDMRNLSPTIRTEIVTAVMRSAAFSSPETMTMVADWKCGASRDLPLGPDRVLWDGAAAEAAIFKHADFDGDTPEPQKASPYFLVHDTSNPTEKGSYKLPFAELADGKFEASPAGLRAAASRLPQTDIPDSVKEHARGVIDAYEKKGGKELDKDKEPDKDTPDEMKAKASLEILGICAAMDVGSDIAAQYIADNLTPDEVRAKIKPQAEQPATMAQVLSLCAKQGISAKQTHAYVMQKLPLKMVKERIAADKAQATDATALDPVPETIKPEDLPKGVEFGYDQAIVARKRAMMREHIG